MRCVLVSLVPRIHVAPLYKAVVKSAACTCSAGPADAARLPRPLRSDYNKCKVGRERQMQRQGAQRAEALAEGSVELAQAMVPQALALARGGG